MPTFKTVIHPRYKKADGVFRVKIRITHNKQSRYIQTCYYASSSEVNEKFDFKRGTSYVRDTMPIIDEYRKICNKCADKIETMNVDQIVELIKNYKEDENFKLDFIAFGRRHIQQLRDNDHKGNADMYQCALNAFVRFLRRNKIDINKITSRVVKQFITFLENEKPRAGHKKGRRSPSLYCATLKALHNVAKAEYNDEDIGVIRIPLSPFSRTKVPPIPRTEKKPMTLEQLRAVFNVPDDDTFQRRGDYNIRNLGRDIGLLSFFLIGINTVDLYNCTGIQNGRLIYNRTKTKNRRQDKAKIDIRIEPEALALIEKYRDPTGVRLFEFHRKYANSDIFNAQVNKGLKRVGKVINFPDLETYTFRRTWASIAWNHCGIRDDIVDFALGHSPREEKKLAHIYITEDWNIVDKANRAVIDFVKSNQTEVSLTNSKYISNETAPEKSVQAPVAS